MEAARGWLPLIAVILIVAQAAPARGYQLSANYSGATFFNHWDFYNQKDPTNGYVYYVTKQQAVQWDLISSNHEGQVYIGCDSTTISSGSGRASVRIQTQDSWNSGLFVLDLDHMPQGCGTWPAWWLVGADWPNNGEVDIIEGVNTQVEDQTTLHTNEGCSQQSEGSPFTGHWAVGSNGKPATNCWVGAPGQYGNQGCSILNSNGASFGTPFNAKGGGTFALEWTASFIRAFFWRKGTEPHDLKTGNPNPRGWGTPYAYFTLGGNCPARHFDELQMVINLTFCGDWAGNTFTQQCPNNGTCDSFVKNNPSAFREAFWLINSLTVYQ